VTRTSLKDKLLRLATACLLPILLQGCISSTVESIREGETSLNEGDKIVILGRRHVGNYETEKSFVTCLGDVLRKKKLLVLDEKTFINALFPWFEPRTAPISPDDLSNLLRWREVAETIREKRIRYMVWVDGTTRTSDVDGTMSCALSPAGVGCLGFVSWEQHSDYEISIWDTEQIIQVGRMSATTSGTSFVPAVLIPVPFVSPVKGNTCRNLGEQISRFLNNQTDQ